MQSFFVLVRKRWAEQKALEGVEWGRRYPLDTHVTGKANMFKIS